MIVFMWTITVTIILGELAITTDSEGNIIDSSEINKNETVAYEIDIDMLLSDIIIQNNINKQVDL